MADCELCEHPEHGYGNTCEVLVDYDHLNGDHECGCPGPMRVIDLIQHLIDSIQQYPEYVDTILRAQDEYGEEYHVTGSDIQGDVWIIISEKNDTTGLCACGARCDHEEVDLLENGRRLASERENLIAQGVDPADLLIPIAPLDPKKEG